MTRFSKRYKYDPSVPESPVETDAPSHLRMAFLKGILNHLTYIDGDSRYENPDRLPIGVKGLIEELAVLFRQEVEDEAYDSWRCEDYLAWMIKNCEWYQFYDAVEKIGELLKAAEKRILFDPEWLEQFGFASYRDKVNRVLRDAFVDWRLDESGVLRRDTPEVLRYRSTRTEGALVDEFQPASTAFRKSFPR